MSEGRLQPLTHSAPDLSGVENRERVVERKRLVGDSSRLVRVLAAVVEAELAGLHWLGDSQSGFGQAHRATRLDQPGLIALGHVLVDTPMGEVRLALSRSLAGK